MSVRLGFQSGDTNLVRRADSIGDEDEGLGTKAQLKRPARDESIRPCGALSRVVLENQAEAILPKGGSMTKKERAKSLKQIIFEELRPGPDNGKLFVEVQAQSKNSLLVEFLHRSESELQVFVQIHITGPDSVRRICDAMAEGINATSEPAMQPEELDRGKE
jgi:hypothetical protein